MKLTRSQTIIDDEPKRKMVKIVLTAENGTENQQLNKFQREKGGCLDKSTALFSLSIVFSAQEERIGEMDKAVEGISNGFTITNQSRRR